MSCADRVLDVFLELDKQSSRFTPGLAVSGEAMYLQAGFGSGRDEIDATSLADQLGISVEEAVGALRELAATGRIEVASVNRARTLWRLKA
jgi:hypothetical protein